MAYKSSAVKRAFALFILACIATSSIAESIPKVSHYAYAVSEPVLVDEFLPCLEALKGLENCILDIFKIVFGVPLSTSCCQVVDHIHKNCLPAELPLSQVPLPVTLKNCIPAPVPPASA